MACKSGTKPENVFTFEMVVKVKEWGKWIPNGKRFFVVYVIHYLTIHAFGLYVDVYFLFY